jgi:inner membrane protein
MPSPFGHSLAGYIIHRATARPVAAHQWQLMLLYLFAANAPDLDFLPGLFAGDLGRYHHGPSHSIGFAILFGLCASAFFSRRLCAFVMGFSLYLSHVLLDYLVQDPSPPLGVPLFWPFNHEYYMAPFAFYRPFDYPVSVAEPMVPLFFTFHNFLTVLTEILFLLPPLVFVSLCRKSTLGSITVSVGWRCARSARHKEKW